MRVVVRHARSNEPTSLSDFADKYNLVLELNERPNWVMDELGKDRWEAYFQGVEVMKNGYPDLVKGWGATPENAVTHYAGILADKQVLVPGFGLLGRDKEVRCPDYWTDTSIGHVVEDI